MDGVLPAMGNKPKSAKEVGIKLKKINSKVIYIFIYSWLTIIIINISINDSLSKT